LVVLAQCHVVKTCAVGDEKQNEKGFTEPCTAKPVKNSCMYFGPGLVLTQKSTVIAATLTEFESHSNPGNVTNSMDVIKIQYISVTKTVRPKDSGIRVWS
jgi:hypothetical protein